MFCAWQKKEKPAKKPRPVLSILRHQNPNSRTHPLAFKEKTPSIAAETFLWSFGNFPASRVQAPKRNLPVALITDAPMNSANENSRRWAHPSWIFRSSRGTKRGSLAMTIVRRKQEGVGRVSGMIGRTEAELWAPSEERRPLCEFCLAEPPRDSSSGVLIDPGSKLARMVLERREKRAESVSIGDKVVGELRSRGWRLIEE